MLDGDSLILLDVSDRLSYIVLRGRRLHVILVNVHAPSEEKSEELKDSFL